MPPLQNSHGLQDTGFARALLEEFAHEVVLFVNRPARLGEHLQLHCTVADTNTSELRFEEAEARGPPAVLEPRAGVSEGEDEDGAAEPELAAADEKGSRE